jgi:hypothetical protein
MLQYPNSQGQSFSTASTVQGGFPQAPSAELPPIGHGRQSVDPSDQPLEFNSRKAPDVAVHANVNSAIPAAPTLATNYDAVAASTHSWTPSATVGFLPRAPLPPQAAQVYRLICIAYFVIKPPYTSDSYSFDLPDGSSCCTAFWSSL